MTDNSQIEPHVLPVIEAELARSTIHIRFKDKTLERQYETERQDSARLHNRVTVPIHAAIFDLFILTEIHGIPEIVTLSIILRFAILSPCALLFVILDWRGLVGRWIGLALVTLAIFPTLAAVIESLFTTSPAGLANLQVLPLAQLVVLTWRINLTQAVIISSVSLGLYTIGMSLAPVVPAAILPTMLLTDVTISAAMLAFVMRLELRDRQVFLLGLKARIDGRILAEQNRELARLSQSDALTGLGNRRYFDETLAQAWKVCAVQQMPIALVMFDIDHFKRFNDSFGHREGDTCLIAVAQAVAHCVRNTTDRLARYGGEEFALILRGATLEDARAIAERMRQAVLAAALPHPCIGDPGVVTISLGIASLVPGVNDSSGLLEEADRGLYAAKRRGRNRVETADGAADEAQFYLRQVTKPGVIQANRASAG